MLTLASVKAYLQVEGDEHDTLLEELLERTIDAVQIELDWYFGPARAVTETLSATGLGSLWLRQPPIGTPLVLSYRVGVGDEWETVDTEDYEIDGRGLHHWIRWRRGFRNYQAVYQEGFDAMPGDVEQLILDLIASRWASRGTNPGMKSETIGDYSYTRGDFESVQSWGSVKNRWMRSRGRI